ncbi:MAG: TOBE domain-containing protein [Methylococcaceae bacterium]|nr:TOBE domain-containing protein [Methylococcaceae bacterium]
MTQSSKFCPTWVEGHLRLAGIDSRMIALLKSIAQCGSITQAAKQCGLSYKGAWQIIERANNSSPKILVSTATGGSKGGGTCLTEAGQSLVDIFFNLENQHNQFVKQLNLELAKNPDACLLLQHLAVKTSVRNQLFGTVSAIVTGAVNVQVTVELTGGDRVVADFGLEMLGSLDLSVGTDAVLLINSTDIALVLDDGHMSFSASNCLACKIIRLQQDEINCEVSVLLPGGEILTSVITTQSLEKMALKIGLPVIAIFKANAPILGVL